MAVLYFFSLYYGWIMGELTLHRSVFSILWRALCTRKLIETKKSIYRCPIFFILTWLDFNLLHHIYQQKWWCHSLIFLFIYIGFNRFTVHCWTWDTFKLSFRRNKNSSRIDNFMVVSERMLRFAHILCVKRTTPVSVIC